MHSPFSSSAAGLLIPVFALRREDDFGIGDTLAMKGAIDFCAKHGFRVLQTLPIHDTVGDHSPYNPVSSRAFSAALLTMQEDAVPGLTKDIIQQEASESWLAQLREGPVKHRLVHTLKLKLLLAAYQSFLNQQDEALLADFQAFQEYEKDWLADYTLFRVLVGEYDNNPHWEQWKPEHQNPATAEAWLLGSTDRERHQQLRDGMAYIQWVAHRQWADVKAYADEKDVLLMGEISFGVSKSSVDVWAQRELFDVEWSMGTRPVSYFDTNKDSERWGQNWGLPPYRWENHRSTDFDWLRRRVQFESRYFHICRLDHLRGYFRAYMFPWQGGTEHSEFNVLTDDEARERAGGRVPRFVPGADDDETAAQMNDLQGREIISVAQEAAGDMYLFAEIMGQMPDYMRQALDDLQLPNLTFPLLEKNDKGRLQPRESFRKLSLISFGNHDHAAITGVYQQLLDKCRTGDEAACRDLGNLLEFAGWKGETPESMTDELLAALQQALFSAPCLLACLTVTDLLGTAQRFNLPGSYGDMTWCERLELPLDRLELHPVYGPRIELAARLVEQAGRTESTSNRRASAPPKKDGGNNPPTPETRNATVLQESEAIAMAAGG